MQAYDLMRNRASTETLGTSEDGPSKVTPEVEALHSRCGVYTRTEVVCRILDAVGWRAEADLSRSRLLEPAAGDGAFVLEAARRLVGAFVRLGIALIARTLIGRITAFELHRGEAEKARSRVRRALRAAGAHHKTAEACAQAWITDGDFLLTDLPRDHFTHAVGNPPYVRWSKIPPDLKAEYEAQVPREMTGGDLFLPFLDQALESLRAEGQCGFLCSDRWRYMAFAEEFRVKWLPRLDIRSELSLSASDAFVADVDSYPTILIACKRQPAQTKPQGAQAKSGKTLADLGYVVKVGPALGHTPAYVLESNEADVEPQLLHAWIDGSEIREGALEWQGRRVVVMYGDDGQLIDPTEFPMLLARLERFRKPLERRSIVRDGAPWFRPIDRVFAAAWRRPKLLVPELAKIPRLTIDRSGAIPSHGVYAIFAPDDDVEPLYERLRDGALAKALDEIAPKVKGDYVRCYKRFLLMITLEN